MIGDVEMLRNLLIFVALLAFLPMVAMADAVVGATPPSGWGQDCTQWITYTDPWNSGELCYDPSAGGGGDGWIDCDTKAQVNWPSLDIELWIEMECVFHWNATHVQIHRASDYSDFEIYLSGGSCCNNGQYIITTPPTATPSLDVLPFVQDMFGRTGSTYGTDIPLTWEANLNGTGFQPMIDLPDNPAVGITSKYFLVPLSCNDWVVRITGDIVFHQEDGYYYLGGPGAFTCPANPM
jgi:hypothetical protein